MKIYSDKEFPKLDTKAVVTIGTFDGLHIGHRKILETTVQKAKNIGGVSIAFTFEPHPRSVISQEYRMQLLTTLDEKIELFEKVGIDYLVVIEFTKEFSSLTYDQFLFRYILGKVKLQELVIGYDHKFGKNREGDKEKISEYGKLHNFQVSTVPEIIKNGETVSSTKIRKYLKEGNLAKANAFLDRFYCFAGKVIKGDQRGRKLGFPTANIDPQKGNKLIPKTGVYTVLVEVKGEKFYGVMNIGARPTFENSENLLVEVHIFNFNKIIYDEEIKLYLIERIRDEKKFSSKEELINQIENDKIKSIEIINKLN